MSTPSKAYEEAAERHAHTRTGDRLVPLISAIIAVLAALGSLFAHHRSIQALAIKNQAIRETIKASDQYNYYQNQRLRVSIYTALIDAGVARDTSGRTVLRKMIDREETASLGSISGAQSHEAAANTLQEHAQTELSSFAVFEIATTLFEISIVLVSISALTRAQALLWTGTGLSAVGMILMIVGYVQGH